MNFDLGTEHWFQQGGFVMYILTIFSIVVIAVTLEKVFFLAKIGRKIDELKQAVKDNDKEKLADCVDDPLFALYYRLAEITTTTTKIDDSLRMLDRAIKRFENRLARGVGWLATIGNTAPFVGLFGTVLGIIRAFRALADADPAAYGGLSSGIAEALIATASGLIVAVPAVILFNFLIRRISNVMIHVRLDAEDFMETLMDSGSSPE